jgi:hypothetical protein
MRRVTFFVAFALAILLGLDAVVHTQAPGSMLLGTWKVNIAKSKYSPASGAPKSATSKFESVQGGIKNTTDGVSAQGTATHTELTFTFDGKDVPVMGATSANTTRAWKRIDDHNYEFVDKVDGKVTTTTRVVISSDGKTRTNTATGKNAQGVAVNNVVVYEKQ